MIEIGDYVTLYNGYKGTVTEINKAEMTLKTDEMPEFLHIVNVRTLNGVTIYAEDLRFA